MAMWQLIDAVLQNAKAVAANTAAVNAATKQSKEVHAAVIQLTAVSERIAVALEKVAEDPPVPVRAEIRIGTPVLE